MIEDDPKIEGQEWMCVSYLPHPEKKALFFNFRGAHKTEDDAKTCAKELFEQQTYQIPIYVAPIGKFIEVPNPFSDNNPSGEEVIPQPKPVIPNIIESDTALSDDILCMACYTEKRNYIYLPCRHICFCHNCMEKHAKNNVDCPICHTKAEQILNVFF